MNRLGRAMADPTRSRILLELLEAPGYPARLSESLALTRTNVSNHLACLRGCGIVVATPEGRQTRYEIADPHLTRAISMLVDTVLAYDDGAPLLGWPGCQRLNRFERRSPLMATDEDVACTCCGRHLPRKKLHALGDDRAFICRRCGWWVALRLHRDRPPA